MNRPMTEAERASHIQAWCSYHHKYLFEPLGFGTLLPQDLGHLVEKERLSFLRADGQASLGLDALEAHLVHSCAPVAPEVRSLLFSIRVALNVAAAHGDNCRHFQAAELAYLRPLIWRNEEWSHHPGT